MEVYWKKNKSRLGRRVGVGVGTSGSTVANLTFISNQHLQDEKKKPKRRRKAPTEQPVITGDSYMGISPTPTTNHHHHFPSLLF
jgi:hypothetical protein